MIDTVSITLKKRVMIALGLVVMACGNAVAGSNKIPTYTGEQRPWADAELKALAQTLAGECFDDKEEDKRKVCEVILNRVSNDGFGDSVISVATAPNQFHGYWRQSRPITENDYRVAAQALDDWYRNGCKALSHYLYFTAGTNRENSFR